MGKAASKVAGVAGAVADHLGDQVLAVGQVADKVVDMASLVADQLYDDIVESVADSSTEAIRTVQQLDAWFDSYAAEIDPGELVTGAVRFTNDLIVDTTQNGLEFALETVTDTVQAAAEVAIDIGKLAAQTNSALIEGVGDLVGESADILVDIKNTMKVVVEMIPSESDSPTSTISDTSEFLSDLYINADAATITGTIGALGVELSEGMIVLAEDSENPDPSSPATITASLPAGPNRTTSIRTTSCHNDLRDWRNRR